MNNYGRNVDTVHLGQSYANKRRISGPRKMPSKGFKDKYKKIIAGILAAGTLLVGANQLSNNRQERNQRLDIVDKFSGALEQTYEGSEYLQLNFRQGDYVEYCEETLNDTLKSEDELVEFLSKEEFDKNTWLYILIGEGNRIDLSDEEIISALQQFEPYSEENITFDKNTGNPDKHVSYFTQLGKACLTEENKVNLILLLDGIVGSSSISNSNEAINYAKEQVKSAYSEIGEGWKDSLRQNININNNFEENSFGSNFEIPNDFGKFEDTPIQNDFVSPNPSFVPNKDNFEVVNNNYGMNNNENLNSFNQDNNGLFNPFNISQPEPEYDNVDDNNVVPSLEDNDTTEIPVIPTHSYDEKHEEPIIIIDEEPTMNNNNFNNFTNNQDFQNMQQPNGNNEFNPFDMMNTAPQTNNFGIPTSSIENSPIMGNDSFSNMGTQNYGVEEAPVNIPNNNNNVLNPGFMDIDKIKNEAVDINSILNNDNNDGFVAPSNNVNNFDINGNIDILPTDGPILRPTQPPRNSSVELEPELQPGKFFNLPIEEEVDKNQEVPLESNPFEFKVNGDPSNMTLNTEGQPRLKTLDEVSQFQEPSYDQSFNQMPSMMNQQNLFINPNNNPVNQFGLPIQENYNNGFNYNSNMQVMPNQTHIPPMETQQNMASFMGNTMMSNQLPSNKNMNLAMDAIKECVNKIKSLGFNVNTEDFDFENMYQIMFRIEK